MYQNIYFKLMKLLLPDLLKKELQFQCISKKTTLKSLLNSKIKLIQNIFPKKRIRSFLVAKTYQILLKKSYNGKISTRYSLKTTRN